MQNPNNRSHEVTNPDMITSPMPPCTSIAFVLDDGEFQESRSKPRMSVINDKGEACLGSVRTTGRTDAMYSIPVTVLKGTSVMRRCKTDKTKDRKFEEGEPVECIWNGESNKVWLKAQSRHNSRDGILYRCKRKDVMDHAEEVGMSVLNVRVQKLGVFGAKRSQSKCFFVPFGKARSNNRKDTGVWVSTKYYNEVMVPQVNSLLERLKCHEEKDDEKKEEEKEEVPKSLFQSRLLESQPQPCLRQMPAFLLPQFQYQAPQPCIPFLPYFWVLPEFQ